MKAHRFDAVSFIGGLAFTLIGLVFLIAQTPSQLIEFIVDAGAWFWPLLLLVIGLAVIIPALTANRQAIDEGDTD